MPDVFGVFEDGAVAGEFADAGGIEHGHFAPARLVFEGLGHLVLRLAIRFEVGEAEEGVVVEEVVAQGSEHIGPFARSEVVGAEPVDDGGEFGISFVEFPRVVSVLDEFGHLFDGVAEDENIVVADLFADFDIGAVERADGDGSVEGEFHVAGAGGFFAGRGDLLGEIGGRNNALGEGNPVVRHEGDLEFALDAGVGVDLGANGVDRLDDELGGVIARRSLGREDEGARRDVEVGVLEQAAVEPKDVEQVEVLALVFVEALDLHIEHGGGVNLNAALIKDALGEFFFVRVFNRHEFLAERSVVGRGLKLAQQVEIALPAAADGARDEVGEARVASHEPAARGDAIGLVVDAARIEFVELGEEVAFNQLGVEGGDAVDRVAADHAQVAHADHLVVAFLDEREGALFGDVAGPLLLYFIEEVLVDLENDLQMTRQDLAEKTDAPLLQGFRQKGVVGVGEGACDDRPRLVPGQTVFVDEEALQFWNADRRVGVVQLDGDFVGEFRPVGIVLLEAADDVAQRAGGEKVLLEEAQFLAGLGVVVRVENLADRLGHVFLADGFLVAATVEGLEVEFLGGFRFPEAQKIDCLRAEARDRNVIGHADDFAEVHPDGAALPASVVHRLNVSVDGDFLLVLRTDDFPRRAVLDPRVGKFDLVAVAEFLLEEAVLVMDAVADGGQIKGGEGIEETGGEASETAVAEGHVVFLIARFFERMAEIFESFADLVVDAGGDHVVGEEAAHEELHGHVVDAADILLVMDREGFHHAFDDAALDGHGGGNPPFAARRGDLVAGHGVFQLVDDFFL